MVTDTKTKIKILVIDDDFLVLRSLAKILNGRGYETKTANSGMKAIELVKKEDFDLVMSDIRMPEMDGVETMRIIEEHSRRHGKSCASMFITAFPEDHRAKEIAHSGRARLMPKPFDVDDLLETVKLELQRHPSVS